MIEFLRRWLASRRWRTIRYDIRHHPNKGWDAVAGIRGFESIVVDLTYRRQWCGTDIVMWPPEVVSVKRDMMSEGYWGPYPDDQLPSFRERFRSPGKVWNDRLKEVCIDAANSTLWS